MATCNDFWERDDGGGEYQQKWLTFTWTTLSTFSWFSRHSEHHSLCHEHKHTQRTSHFLNITFDIKYIDLDKITWLTEWCNSTCWWATAITKVLLIQECLSSECSFCLTYTALTFCTSDSGAWHTDTPRIFAQWMKCAMLETESTVISWTTKKIKHFPIVPYVFVKKKQTTPKFSIIP